MGGVQRGEIMKGEIVDRKKRHKTMHKLEEEELQLDRDSLSRQDLYTK